MNTNLYIRDEKYKCKHTEIYGNLRKCTPYTQQCNIRMYTGNNSERFCQLPEIIIFQSQNYPITVTEKTHRIDDVYDGHRFVFDYVAIVSVRLFALDNVRCWLLLKHTQTDRRAAGINRTTGKMVLGEFSVLSIARAC